MERFNLKKLNKVEGKGSVVLRSQIGLQLWKIWMLRLKLKLSGKQLGGEYQNVSQRESRFL
jgi:hypothetical protein